MGTEVLRPHDPLSRAGRRHHASTKRSSPRPSSAARRHHGGGAARRGQAAAASPVLPRVKVAAAEAAYAGPAFGAMSPSPRALPLPRFSTKAAAATVDDSATRELRRLLGLERSTTN